MTGPGQGKATSLATLDPKFASRIASARVSALKGAPLVPCPNIKVAAAIA